MTEPTRSDEIVTNNWPDQIPESWDVVPLRAVADYEVSNVDKNPSDEELPVRLCNYVDVYHNEFITLNLDFMQATATPTEITKFGLNVNDVIVTKDSESWDDIGVPALVREATPDLVCGYHLAQIRPRGGLLSGAFLLRCLQSKPIRLQFELSANGVTRFGLPKAAIGAARLPLPPLETQRAIADFLDAETARIDALIAAKENLLAILAEKRRALVTNAVTCGLDPGVPMRDSGIPWLGEIPEHWEVTRLKFLLEDIEQGWSPQCDNYPAGPEDWGVLKAGCVNGDAFDEKENKRLPDDLNPRTEYEIHPGDFLISRANTTALVGSATLVRETRHRLLLCDKLYRLRIYPDSLEATFLELFFGTPVGRYEFERDASGASGSMQNISQEAVRNLWIALPPRAEQIEIVATIREDVLRSDLVMSKTRETLTLLRERREAIIAAAVTGQLNLEAR